MLKKFLITSFCFLIFNLTQSQEQATILLAPDNWNTEQISFPLSFAPEIDFKGFEDIRFAPGWSKPDSDEFWTYHFTWYIDKREPMTEAFLSITLTTYYNGLIKAVLGGQENNSIDFENLEKSQCQFTKTEDLFKGRARVFDAFFSKDYVTLNIKVREKFCERSGKQIVSFDISPQAFDNEIWKIFDKVKIVTPCN